MIVIGRLLCATRVLLSQVVLELTLYDRRRAPSFATSKRYTRAVLPPAILACSSAGTPARKFARILRDWGKRRFAVRIVGAPHHVVDADDVSQANADGILLKAQHEVAVEEGRQQPCYNRYLA
jgi:hypothetical protein